MPPHRPHIITQLMSTSSHACINQMVPFIMFSLIFQSRGCSVQRAYIFFAATLSFSSPDSLYWNLETSLQELISDAVGRKITEAGHQVAASSPLPLLPCLNTRLFPMQSFVLHLWPQSALFDITSSSHSIQDFTRAYALLSVRLSYLNSTRRRLSSSGTG
jgi:hypothetical protein